MVLQSGGFITKERSFKLPLSTGPIRRTVASPKLLLVVYECHLESRLGSGCGSNCSERKGLKGRNSRRNAVSES